MPDRQPSEVFDVEGVVRRLREMADEQNTRQQVVYGKAGYLAKLLADTVALSKEQAVKLAYQRGLHAGKMAKYRGVKLSALPPSE